MVAPMQRPSSSVTILVISFSAAFFRRSTTPLSLIKLPSMTVPIKRRAFGRQDRRENRHNDRENDLSGFRDRLALGRAHDDLPFFLAWSARA